MLRVESELARQQDHEEADHQRHALHARDPLLLLYHQLADDLGARPAQGLLRRRRRADP